MWPFLFALLLLLPSSASAAWKVEKGRKLLSLKDDPVGMIAKLPAQKPTNNISAFLQIECFQHPQLSGKTVGIILSRGTAPGPISWQYKFDEHPAVIRGPFSRTSLTVIGLGDARSAEFIGVSRSKALDLTLIPASGEKLQFSFDLSGVEAALKAIPCVEKYLQ